MSGASRPPHFRWTKTWAPSWNPWAGCSCNSTAPSICSTARVPRGESLSGSPAGWIKASPPISSTCNAARSSRTKSPGSSDRILLLTDHGLRVTELDSVPGGIGLTAWLNQTYSRLGLPVIGGEAGMIEGFASIMGKARAVHIVVSEEAATYRPEMAWLAEQIDSERWSVRDGTFDNFADGDAVYRFFELFDLPNVSNSGRILELASAKTIRLTPAPKPLFEEKMLFALLWNRHLHGFWRQELGEGFFRLLQRLFPVTWLVDPAPLPPHAAIPELNLTDWRQLETLSHKERELILKVSGFSPHAWGARGVYLGSDLSHADWATAVRKAVASFPTSPYVLQRYHKPALVDAPWYDFEREEVVSMKGRARLCPYYFVTGEGDAMRARLGGALATICPANKKIIHGMTEAVFAPCAVNLQSMAGAVGL